MSSRSWIYPFIFLLPLLIQAHPTSFKGSKGIMGNHTPFLSHHQLNYSFEYYFATGVHYISRPDKENRWASFASGNLLAKRWNGSGHQANLYINLGMGASALNEASAQPAGFGLIQFDIEDRDYYFLIKHLRSESDEQTEFHQSIIRFGITPYVDPFDGFHSWVILEAQSSRFADGGGVDDVTPFLRFFYRNFLFEIGQSFDGATKFNYITHF